MGSFWHNIYYLDVQICREPAGTPVAPSMKYGESDMSANAAQVLLRQKEAWMESIVKHHTGPAA